MNLPETQAKESQEDQRILEEQDVTLEAISAALHRAAMDHEVRAGHLLYVCEAGMFPLWVSLRPEPRYVLLHTFIEWVEGTLEAERLRMCNQINTKLYIPSAYDRQSDDAGRPLSRLMMTYPIFYRGGLIVSHFVRLCRSFSDNIIEFKQGMDPDDRLLKPIWRKEVITVGDMDTADPGSHAISMGQERGA